MSVESGAGSGAAAAGEDAAAVAGTAGATSGCCHRLLWIVRVVVNSLVRSSGSVSGSSCSMSL